MIDLKPAKFQAADKGQVSTRLRGTESGGIKLPHRCQTQIAYTRPRLRIQPTSPAPKLLRRMAAGAGTAGGESANHVAAWGPK